MTICVKFAYTTVGLLYVVRRFAYTVVNRLTIIYQINTITKPITKAQELMDYLRARKKTGKAHPFYLAVMSYIITEGVATHQREYAQQQGKVNMYRHSHAQQERLFTCSCSTINHTPHQL